MGRSGYTLFGLFLRCLKLVLMLSRLQGVIRARPPVSCRLTGLWKIREVPPPGLHGWVPGIQCGGVVLAFSMALKPKSTDLLKRTEG